MVTNSIRLRPGQIIVGEAHDAETAALLDAWSTGLQGGEPIFRPDTPKQP
jgi:Flp pilus assembly CpaF family ATPase